MSQLEKLFGEVIFSYSRAQALADGVLIDVTQQAQEYGFRYPVAVTSTVWEDCIRWNNDIGTTYQDGAGRLADMLWMAARAAKSSKGTLAVFDIQRIAHGQSKPSTVTLKSICGPGDSAEPVITIMFPEED